MWIQAWRMGGISSYCEAMLSLPFQLLYVDSTSTPLMGGIPALSTQNIARWTRQLNDKQNHSICAPGGVAALAVETMR